MLYSKIIKPVTDPLIAFVSLLFLSPVLLILALVIRCRMGAPILFRQVRIGLNEQPFLFLKFRTMSGDKDSHGRLLPDEKRLTRVGQFLRSASLDELPQLWNVVRGDMSLIGPRPLLPEYLPRYSAFQARRHEVKPGITGWAQVKGRNSLAWEEKFNADVWYVDRLSFRLDLKIVWMTFRALLTRDGISQLGHATMPVFLGSSCAPEESHK